MAHLKNRSFALVMNDDFNDFCITFYHHIFHFERSATECVDDQHQIQLNYLVDVIQQPQVITLHLCVYPWYSVEIFFIILFSTFRCFVFLFSSSKVIRINY